MPIRITEVQALKLGDPRPGLNARVGAAVPQIIEIIVFGVPVAQGNHRASPSGHIYETTKNHRPWRDSVGWAARENGEHISGPIAVEMIFTMPKPKSAPKHRVTFPDRKPDLSKMVRSTEDALTIAGVWEDDARVIRCTASKVYPGEGVNALNVPGAVIRIWAVSAMIEPRGEFVEARKR